MLDKLKKQDWSGCLHQPFSATLAGHDTPDQEQGLGLELELIEVMGLGEQPGAQREPYSLVFRGPAQPAFEQQIVVLNHPQLGRLDLFLVPIGPDRHGMRYEAVVT